jgi:hypothetical protein
MKEERKMAKKKLTMINKECGFAIDVNEYTAFCAVVDDNFIYLQLCSGAAVREFKLGTRTENNKRAADEMIVELALIRKMFDEEGAKFSYEKCSTGFDHFTVEHGCLISMKSIDIDD